MIWVPVSPAPSRRCCASSAWAREANGPANTCCQPAATRWRIGSPSVETSAATKAARDSVRKEATTISKRSPAGLALGDAAAAVGAAIRAGAAGDEGACAAGALGGADGVAVGGGTGTACVAGCGAGDAARTANQITTATSTSEPPHRRPLFPPWVVGSSAPRNVVGTSVSGRSTGSVRAGSSTGVTDVGAASPSARAVWLINGASMVRSHCS